MLSESYKSSLGLSEITTKCKRLHLNLQMCALLHLFGLFSVVCIPFIRILLIRFKSNKIYSGSWIDKTFQYWIGEPTKNKAWSYLKDTKNTLEVFSKQNKNHPQIEAAHNELMIAQGSDWFWWYGDCHHELPQ